MNLSELQYNPALKLNDLKILWVEKSISYHEGNKVHAAKALGISLKGLYTMLEKNGVYDKYVKRMNPANATASRQD